MNTGFAGAIARCEAERHRERQRRAIAAEDRNRDRSSRRTPQLRRITLWQKGRDHPELTDPAMRTACLLDARDPLHELGDRLDHRGRRWRHVECRTSSRQSLLFARRREQTVVTDPLETGRQDVLQKAVDELGSRHVQCALLAAGGIGADTQEHVVAVDAENPLVGDRHSVRVAAEVLEHRFGTTEWLLGIDHPVMGVESLLQTLPVGWGGHELRQAVSAAQGLDSGNELAAKDL